MESEGIGKVDIMVSPGIKGGGDGIDFALDVSRIMLANLVNPYPHVARGELVGNMNLMRFFKEEMQIVVVW